MRISMSRTQGTLGTNLVRKYQPRQRKEMDVELKSKFAVGKYVCEMSYSKDRGRLEVTWSPDIPARGSLKGCLAQYRAGRDLFLQQIADDLGINVAVVEV
jgi:hypothetical protein